MIKNTLKQAYNFNTFFQEIIKKTQITPLLVTGPSGVGKSTFVDKLIKESHPNVFQQTVNYTSRNPRPLEKNGKDYYFITPENFVEMINEDQFIEHTNHYETYYGSSKKEVIKIIESGKIPVFVIDIVGAVKIMNTITDVNRIFIKPPCVEELRKRLLDRGTESLEKVELRVKKAYDELEAVEKLNLYKPENIILNDNLDSAYSNFLNQIQEIYDLENLALRKQENQQQQKQIKQYKFYGFGSFNVQPIPSFN